MSLPHPQPQPEGRFSPPTLCEGKCRSRTFEPKKGTAKTVDFQKIKLQEIVQDEEEVVSNWEGRVPRTIDVELTDDLVDLCVPGDIVSARFFFPRSHI